MTGSGSEWAQQISQLTGPEGAKQQAGSEQQQQQQSRPGLSSAETYAKNMDHEHLHSVGSSSGTSGPGKRLNKAAKRTSLWGAIFSRTLPQYGGEYHVGVRDVEVNVPHQSFGNFVHRNFPDTPAGVDMETCLFSVFYPSEPPEPSRPSSKVVWFPRLGQTIDGFLRMARRAPNWLYRTVTYPLAAAAIWGTTFPADKDAPLLSPAHNKGGTETAPKKWPVVYFSHGVGCSRLMYSAFCGEMASRGYVVVALEHRDGTGPSTTIELDDGGQKIVSWLDWRDLHWPDLETQPEDDTALRKVQLQLRLAELEQVNVQVQSIAQGGGVARHTTDGFDWSRWKHAIDTFRPIMSGHSFGGTLALAAAAGNRFSFSSIIAFDPAVQRLEPWNSSIKEPMLVINSEEFVKGSEYGKLTKLSQTASNSTIFSIAGSTHPSFSDVHLILPAFINRRTGLKVHAATIFDVCIPAVEAFLDHRYDELKEMAAQDLSEALEEDPPNMNVDKNDPLAPGSSSSNLQVPTEGSSSRLNNTRNRSKSTLGSNSGTPRHEPGAFLFHSSTQVSRTDLAEEEAAQ